MKRILLSLLICFGPFAARPARADMFGADIPILLEILANAVKQLIQLQQALNTARSQLNLIKDINRGISNSIDLIRGAYPGLNPGIYREWDRISRAIEGVTEVYGEVPTSRDQRVQHDADQSVAEAISLNNDLYKYSQTVARISDQLRDMSVGASPGRAQQLTAASLASLIALTNQSLRTQATGLKLQAQALALGNRKEKEETRTTLKASSDLSSAMRGMDPSFELPRF